MNIGLFGGSFNPPHTGHLWLADEFRIKGKLDLIWILVSPDPPHKDPDELVAYEHRLEMTRLTFMNSFGVELNKIEEDLAKPGYTYRTVEALKIKHPGSDFSLCIGEDSLFDLPKWMEPERLLSNVNLLVARRGGYNQASELLPSHWANKLSYIDIEPRLASSTEIRRMVALGESVEGQVTPEVLNYIHEQKLYQAKS